MGCTASVYIRYPGTGMQGAAYMAVSGAGSTGNEKRQQASPAKGLHNGSGGALLCGIFSWGLAEEPAGVPGGHGTAPTLPVFVTFYHNE